MDEPWLFATSEGAEELDVQPMSLRLPPAPPLQLPFERAQRAGKKAFDGMREAEAEVWATDCPLAAIQFQQFAGRKPMHPMSILARAYRDDGFPTPVAKEPS